MANRRDFLKTVTAGLAAASLPALGLNKSNDFTAVLKDMEPVSKGAPMPILLPPGLTEGMTVAITAPASPVTTGSVAPAVKFFKNMGLKVEIGDTIRESDKSNKYFSAPDEERAVEFMEFAKRDDIACIMTGRGGYGVMRILPMIDFDILKRKPKVILGYSDITALLLAVYKKSKLVTFHGPVASSQFNSFQSDFLKQLIFKRDKFEPVVIRDKSAIVLSKGSASGKLIGGNLSIVAGTLGTPYEPDTKDAILFLEETREEPYKIDRMLTQLKLAGKFDRLKGIVFGNFNKIDARKSFYPGRSFTVREIIQSLVSELDIPVMLGMPFGHDKLNATLPIGVNAEMNTSDTSLVIRENSVA